MQHDDYPKRRFGLRLGIAVVATAAVALAWPAGTASGQNAGAAAGEMPRGYRDWTLVSLAALGPPYNDIRAKLGNAVAIRAFRDGSRAFPDGAIIARLAWKRTSSEPVARAFRNDGAAVGLSRDATETLLGNSFVAGPATNVQFMFKDSRKYASTGGWRFAQFTSGKPDAIVQNTCLACHAQAADRDFVFTAYSP